MLPSARMPQSSQIVCSQGQSFLLVFFGFHGKAGISQSQGDRVRSQACPTHLLLPRLGMGESHEVHGEVAQHSFGFTGLPNFEAESLENPRIHGTLWDGGARRSEGSLSVELLSRCQQCQLPRGLYQQIHCDVGDAARAGEGFDHPPWNRTGIPLASNPAVLPFRGHRMEPAAPGKTANQSGQGEQQSQNGASLGGGRS